MSETFEIWWCTDHGWVTSPEEEGDDRTLCPIHVGQDDTCLIELEGPWPATVEAPPRGRG